jgi:hypothetical protein
MMPSLDDSLARLEGEPEGYHRRRTTDGGYPLMGSSDAERAEAQQRTERIRAEVMRDHPFVGEQIYCEDMGAAMRSGDPATTGVITMRIQCGYPRDCHPA